MNKEKIIYGQKRKPHEESFFVFFVILLVIEHRSQFKFAEDGISLCSDLPLLVVVSWETDAVETSSTDGEGANLF